MPSWLEPFIGPGVVAAVLGWAGVRLVKRVDDLEKGKADRSELKEFISEIREDRATASQTRTALYERVNTMAESLARLEGRIASK